MSSILAKTLEQENTDGPRSLVGAFETGREGSQYRLARVTLSKRVLVGPNPAPMCRMYDKCKLCSDDCSSYTNCQAVS